MQIWNMERETERDMEQVAEQEMEQERGQCHQRGEEPTRHIAAQEPLLLIHRHVSLMNGKLQALVAHLREHFLPLSGEDHARPALFVRNEWQAPSAPCYVYLGFLALFDQGGKGN